MYSLGLGVVYGFGFSGLCARLGFRISRFSEHFCVEGGCRCEWSRVYGVSATRRWLSRIPHKLQIQQRRKLTWFGVLRIGAKLEGLRRRCLKRLRIPLVTRKRNEPPLPPIPFLRCCGGCTWIAQRLLSLLHVDGVCGGFGCVCVCVCSVVWGSSLIRIRVLVLPV